MNNKNDLIVLQVIPELNISGASQGCIDISNYLSKNKIKNFIMTKGGIRTHQIPPENLLFYPVHSKNPLIIIYNIFIICFFIYYYNISIIHARSRAPAWSCYFASIITNTKFVTTFHGTYGYTNKIKQFYNSVMLRTDGTIAISNHIKKEIHKYDIKPKNLEIIYNGIDFNKFKANLEIPILTKKNINVFLGDCKQQIRILLPGRLTYWKGHEDLLLAGSYIKKTRPELNFKIIFVGEGERNFKKKILDCCKKYNMENNCTLIPGNDNIEYYYAMSDLVVSAAIEPEAFGRVSVESQAMGKFCIASKHGGSIETIIENETGFFYKPKNASELSEKILKAIDEKKINNKEISEKCFQNVYKNFNKNTMNEKYLSFYFKILGN